MQASDIGPRATRVIAFAATLALCVRGVAHAQVTSTDDEERGGLRQQLVDRGIQTVVVYDGAAFDDLAGGVRRGTTYLGTPRLQLTLDGLRLAGFPGMTLFVEGLNIHGGHPSSFAGDAQGVEQPRGAGSLDVGRGMDPAWHRTGVFTEWPERALDFSQSIGWSSDRMEASKRRGLAHSDL